MSVIVSSQIFHKFFEQDNLTLIFAMWAACLRTFSSLILLSSLSIAMIFFFESASFSSAKANWSWSEQIQAYPLVIPTRSSYTSQSNDLISKN